MTGHVQPERVKGPGGTQQRKTFSRINDGRRRREGTDRLMDASMIIKTKTGHDDADV